MADDGWDVSDAITTATPVAVPHGASSDGWDVSDAVTPIGPPTTSAYEAAGGRSTWGDVGQALVAGGHGVAADAAGALAAVQEPGGPQVATQSFALGQDQATRDAEQGMTPAAQAPGFFKHPLVSAAEAAPGIAALGAPAALAGPFAPAVVGGLMGAQQLGAAQNRAAGQGYELTPEQKLTQFGVGAATGLIPELGLPGKIMTTPLIDRALGIAEGAGVFGGGAVAGEIASQQSEIGAGKRTGYDPSAIVSAGEEQAGVGAVFKLTHGSGAKPQTPGEATVGRITPAQRASESKRTDGSTPNTTTAPADEPASVANAGPPPPAPKVDPAQEAALNPPPVTLGVTKPPNETVEQPEVVQPKVPPSTIDREAPPAGDTTQPLPPPQPEAEPQPPATAGPPREDAGAIVPETDAVRREQFAALTDSANPREAMVYDKGVQPFELTDKKAFGQARLPDGRIVQFDRSGPSGLSAAKIQQYAKDNRLNEALQLGPVDKDQAIARASAGEPGVVVTERTPDGTPVKEAVGTTATAPEQVASLEASKTPGSVIGVEHPADTLAERLEAQPQPQPQVEVVQPERAVTPFGPGRILEAQTSENYRARNEAAMQEALYARSRQDELKAKEAARQAAAAQAAGEKPRSHKGKLVDLKVANDNEAARKIADAHPFAGFGHNWVNDTYARAKAMVKAAREADVNIPSVFKEGHPYDPAMLKLREAHDLVTNDKGKPYPPGKYPTNEKYGTFLTREKLIDDARAERAKGTDEGNNKAKELEDQAFATRRAEGAQGYGSVGMEKSDVEKVPEPHELEKPEDVKEQAEREGPSLAELADEHAERGEGGGEAPEEKPTDAFTAAREERDRKLAAARAESEALRKESAPALKAAMGFQVAKVKNRSIKRQELEEEPPKQVMATNSEGNPVGVEPQRSSTVGDALSEHYDPKRYAPEMRPMMERLKDAVTRIAGDTPVHYISHDDMLSLGERARGLYDPVKNHVLLNADKMTHDTALHEAFHDATSKALNADPELKSLMGRLQAEMGVKDEPEEFLTRLMTDNKLQDQFKNTKISPELARDIGIPKWRKATMWEGALNLMRRALGLGPRDISAVEAAMAISEKAMWKRDPGMAMEAGARSLGLKFQRMDPPERDQEAFIRSPSEKIAQIRSIDKQLVAQHAKDFATNAGASLGRASMKVLSGSWMNNIHGHLFEDGKGKILDAINHARDKVSSTYGRLMDSDKDIINRGYMLDRVHASQMPAYARLVDLSNTHNIHADRDAPKVPKKGPVDAPRKNWQGNEFYPEARAIYDHLPEDLQKRYRDEKRFYMDKQGQTAGAIINKVMPLFKPPDGSTLEEVMARARNNDLNDDDWAHYAEQGVEAPLRKASNLMSKKDVYFNGQRDGRYGVTGEYDMPAGGATVDHAGEQLPDNKREFDTEQEAHAYATGTHMKAVTSEVHYWTDKATGVTRRVNSDFATSAPGTEATKYQVRLERQNTQFHDSRAEAGRMRQAMEADGVKNLSGVFDKRDEKAWSKINSADQNRIEAKIDSRTDLTPAERQHLKDISRQMMLSGQGGMGAHMIMARKVAGGQYDTASGLHAYARASNFHIAREEHAADINDGMSRLDAHEKAQRTADPDNATRMSQVANEYRDRVYGRNADALTAKSSPFMHRMMTWAFMNFLVRPSHVLLSQVHPYIYSVPMMAARHGYWKALQGQRQAMKDLGGNLNNLKAGMKAGYDVYKSGKERDIDRAVQMAHGVDPIRVMIARLKSADEREFLNKMWDTQHLHSAYDASVFSGSGPDRANAVIRQFTDAMEANNRLSTALNAYRLEKAMHPDNALPYARRVIEETHGVFSPTNTASVFKNPIIRPIMQFRQQPMNLALMMYRNIFKALPESMGGAADSEARWTLAYQLGTAAALGGMGGMPMDLPKLAGIAGQALGGPSPSDWADKEQRLLTGLLGETGANVINEGLPGMMGPFGPSLGHRTGFDAGFLFGEPSSERPDDMLSYGAKMAAGATGGMAIDWLTAIQNMEKGEYERAAEGVLPGSLKDFAKSYRLATEGSVAGSKEIRPASYGDALLQFLGFAGVERERQMAGHYALQKAIKDQPQTKGEQLKAKHQQKQSVLGVGISKKNASLASEYGSAYQ
jgi:hypothetical protein